VRHGLLTVEASPSIRHTTVGRTLLTRDHFDADASTRQNSHTSLTRVRISCPRRNSELESQHAGGAHQLLRPRDLRLRPLTINIIYNSYRDFVGDLEVNVYVDGITLLQ